MYLQPHMLMQWNGLFYSDPGNVWDTFSGQLRFPGTPEQLGPRDSDQVARDLVTAMETFWANSKAQIPSYAHLSTLKWNMVGRDGKYMSRSNTRFASFINNPGGPGGAGYPLQVAFCSTWTTEATRGPAHSGRTFWPTGIQLNANHLIDPPILNGFATAATQLIRELNAASGLQASVMSNIGEGTTRPITGIKLGNRLDIQRRRANDTAETYAQYSISTT